VEVADDREWERCPICTPRAHPCAPSQRPACGPLTMSNTTAAVELTTLLASPTATLVYAIPLLIASLALTFAGTFLTLDRSRSFSPKHDKTDKFIYSSYESFEKRRNREWLWWWRLEGGVGGLAEGYVFGGEFCLHRTSRQRRTRI
jgi:hypothetical protein